ncbi:MAG TPA: hypothetical protein VJ939_01215 [Bacteroidales bacterium]|nr:hypothetical protein [Bacteroidales bacterium]
MKRIIFVLLVFVFVSCEEDVVIPDKGVFQDKALATELKSKAQNSFRLNGDLYTLEAFAWRDFMPISPPDGKALISINRLINNNSNPIADELNMVQQYVIYDHSVWVTGYEKGSGNSSINWQREKVSGNGPKWGPNVYVDVISVVRNTITNKEYYLIDRKIHINRTD